jgi:hypothetical protein
MTSMTARVSCDIVGGHRPALQLLLLRNLQFLQFCDDVLTGIRGIHHLVDCQDLSIRTDIERPAIGQFTEISSVIPENAVLICGLLGWISEEREVCVFLFCERDVLFQGIGADHEVCDVECSNESTALTERSAFGGSATGKRFREPRQYDGFPSQFR